jgi:hypothetical protein
MRLAADEWVDRMAWAEVCVLACGETGLTVYCKKVEAQYYGS